MGYLAPSILQYSRPSDSSHINKVNARTPLQANLTVSQLCKNIKLLGSIAAKHPHQDSVLALRSQAPVITDRQLRDIPLAESLPNSLQFSMLNWLYPYTHFLFTPPKRTRQNCLVLSAVVFKPPTRQDKTVLSRLQCSHRQRGLVESGSRRDKTVLSAV